MSSGFSKDFLKLAEEATNSLVPSQEEDGSALKEKTNKVDPSPTTLLTGDVIFFSYFSEKYSSRGSHLTLVVGNKRNKFGTFTHMNTTGRNRGRARIYMSAVKLNSIWSNTAGLIISVFNQSLQKNVKTTKYTKEGFDKFKKGMISLVGRSNYRTYILNNMTNVYKINNVPSEEV